MLCVTSGKLSRTLAQSAKEENEVFIETNLRDQLGVVSLSGDLHERLGKKSDKSLHRGERIYQRLRIRRATSGWWR